MTSTAVHGRILIVDDDDAMRLLLGTALRDAGHQVVEAHHGQEALEVARRGGIDAIVTDIAMPVCDGFELLRQVRADVRTASLPLILLTSLSAHTEVVAGLRAGADDYVSKPVEIVELVARVEARLARPPVPVLDLTPARNVGVVTSARFEAELGRELVRAERSGRTGALALVDVAEASVIATRLGRSAGTDVLRQLATLISHELDALDLVGLVTNPRTGQQVLGILMPETDPAVVRPRLAKAMALVAQRALDVEGETLRVTPVAGWLDTDQLLAGDGPSSERLLAQAALAMSSAQARLDLVPVRWDPDIASDEPHTTKSKVLLTAGQVAGSFVLGMVLPFFVYLGLYHLGIDVSWPAYLIVLASLLVTAGAIWRECLFALDPRRPPDEPSTPYPKATALVCAYLPNEAATIVETVRQFLALPYEGDLQVILAYNTPTPMPVEQTLHEIARADPRFVPFRVDHSTSKAQNVNAALTLVQGQFVGMFDADHHPGAGSFERAWRWLSSGVDVVQGHCVVRNGTASRVARMVAVEFEAVYAVSHPGRARAHGFGLFGGSNGYWSTSVLRETRMQATMLTEDIDSGIRALYDGREIVSDPALLSYELAPTSVRALWRQRLRWSQGWFQVSRKHLREGLANPRLSRRQKFGLVMLLGWRELYPWISLQMIPVIALMAYEAGGVANLDWLVTFFLATTVFTASAGPVQTLFAYRLAAPSVRREKRWFWLYLLVSVLAYTEFKNVVARLAQLKELSGERRWIVTPREVAAEPVARDPA